MNYCSAFLGNIKITYEIAPAFYHIAGRAFLLLL